MLNLNILLATLFHLVRLVDNLLLDGFIYRLDAKQAEQKHEGKQDHHDPKNAGKPRGRSVVGIGSCHTLKIGQSNGMERPKTVPANPRA